MTPHRLGKMHLSGFTLIEVLVAAAVMALLFVVLSQVIAMTRQAISLNTGKLDASGQARAVFDRLAKDLSAKPSHPDLDMVVTKAAGNDSLRFFSQVNGYTDSSDAASIRGIAEIGYKIEGTSAGGRPAHQLLRGASGTSWQAAGSQALNFHAQPSPKDADYDVLGNGVFRQEIVYLLDTGVFSNSTGSTDSNDYSRVKAVVVGIAVLDAASRDIIRPSADADLQILADSLTDTGEGKDPMTQWTSDMAQAGFASGVPQKVIQGVRLYQRIFNVK